MKSSSKNTKVKKLMISRNMVSIFLPWEAIGKDSLTTLKNIVRSSIYQELLVFPLLTSVLMKETPNFLSPVINSSVINSIRKVPLSTESVPTSLNQKTSKKNSINMMPASSSPIQRNTMIRSNML